VQPTYFATVQSRQKFLYDFEIVNNRVTAIWPPDLKLLKKTFSRHKISFLITDKFDLIESIPGAQRIVHVHGQAPPSRHGRRPGQGGDSGNVQAAGHLPADDELARLDTGFLNGSIFRTIFTPRQLIFRGMFIFIKVLFQNIPRKLIFRGMFILIKLLFQNVPRKMIFHGKKRYEKSTQRSVYYT
jgi:hypothetical protein